MADATDSVRIDKWLWAARFFKTRSMAAQAVKGGKVHVNGNRVKAARNVAIGDQLVISIGPSEFHVTVLGLSQQRRPAKEAVLLYMEDEVQRQRRLDEREMRKLANAGYTAPGGRPSKRDRRRIIHFTKNKEE